MIGTAPVPVPPPRPEVMKTMSAPCRASMIFSESSRAACRPTSGLLPAPSPLVSLAPIWIFSGAREPFRAWQSVFATMNSTPCRLVEIIRLTALLPPPPTPITLMFAPTALFSSKDSLRAPFASLSSIRIIRSSS